MWQLIAILLTGLVFEAIGVVFLSKGLKQLPALEAFQPGPLLRLVGAGATNPSLLLGVFFEALFFGCLLVLMRRSDVSFIWPLTSLGFVLTTLAAKLFLQEQISWTRWTGVCLIMAGAALITWSEQQKRPHAPPAAAAETSPRAP